MRRRWLALGLVCLGIAGAARHALPPAQLDPLQRRVTLDAQMHPVLLRALALDLRPAVAAIKWLDSLMVVGDASQHRDFMGPQKTWLFKSLRSQIYLDPYGLDTYYLAGGIFTTFSPPHYPQFAANLLLYGAMHRTEDWRIVMSLGQLLYSQYDAREQAEVVWEIGTQMERTPGWLPGLVAMLKVERNDLASAELLLASMLGDDKYADADNPFVADMKRMRQAIKDVQILQRLAADYERAYGEVLPSLDKLVALGIMRFVPLDPWGVAYWWDPVTRQAIASERLIPYTKSQSSVGLPAQWLTPAVAQNLLSEQWGIIN